MSWNNFFGEVFTNVLPELAFNILVGLLIIFLGIALGFLVKKIVMGILKGLKFEKLMEQVKLHHAFGKTSSTEIVADIAEALVILSFLVQGLHYMGFQILSSSLASVLAWTPYLIAGLVIFAVFFVLAKYIESRIQESKVKNSDSVSRYVFGAILTIGAVVGLRQIGIETGFIEQALLIVIFGFALAFALAVGISMGLGLKGDARKLVTNSTNSKPAKSSKPSKSKKRK